MSREFSKSRTHSPVDSDIQRILNLDSSPGSSRKHGEEGEDEGVHIPNFSKEVSLDSEDDPINQAVNTFVSKRPESQASTHLVAPIEIPKNVSPKSILKRRAPEPEYIGITETRENTKCCHPLVNKIKHLADKTLHKLDRSENEKSPTSKRKKNDEAQEIRQLKNSPGAVRRQKFGAIKLGDSDEMSKTMSIDTPPSRKKKEHIYEDIDDSKTSDIEKSLQFTSDSDKPISDKEECKNNNKENDSITEKKSIASHDPSLIAEDNISLKSKDQIMEKLHKKDDVNKEAILLDEEMDSEEPNVDEIFQNQVNDSRPKNDSPNITITEIMDDDTDNNIEQSTTIPIESSPSPSPRDIERKGNDDEFQDKEWSKPNSDHEYEIIEKPPPNIIYTAPSLDEKPTMVKTDDELSSTTSLERKYLQHTSDEEEPTDYKENLDDSKMEDISSAAVLQKDIEERFFVNTPSTVSRTDCDLSTSQVDSSALENLPLKRGSRNKTAESTESKIQQRIKEGTGKLRSQAGKLKTKIQNMKTKQFTMPDRPKFNMPQKPKFFTDLSERTKISFPERPKFTLPDRRKFSLPDRPKFNKKNSISDKLSMGDRKKFSFPERPKFNVPDLSKFKMPDRPKINFPSLGRKKDYKVENDTTESTSDLQNVATVEFEAKTFPRLFTRTKKSQIQKTSSSPTLNREDTPPPTFTFTRVKKPAGGYIPDSPEEPREYGNVEGDTNYESESEERKHFETTYDFDKLSPEYADGDDDRMNLNETRNAASIPDMSLSKQENTHINEINNDEFFVRPKGISRENIQVREYLSDEIRQAFKIPKNVLGLVGSNAEVDDKHMYANEPDADPELMIDENETIRYSAEDINERDDGYYTFPPVRPSRAKRKKKETESIKYIDDSVNASIQFSDVDLGLPDDQLGVQPTEVEAQVNGTITQLDFPSPTDLRSIHEYANDDIIEYSEKIPIQSQTLPMPPKRTKKHTKKEMKYSSLSDFKQVAPAEKWKSPQEQTDDIIVYRTEHEYVVPQEEIAVIERSPLPPRRTRSRSSRGTSLCDDDRTSHGAESLTLDTHALPADEIDVEREIRHESPGYATVDKGPYAPSKGIRRSKSKTPPVRRRKSNSSERKYYTVGATKQTVPDRPPRKKSSTSLVTLDSVTKRSLSGDITQYVEIDEPQIEEVHKDLKSGEVLSKMKDRPLPPPPRPPRGPRRKKRSTDECEEQDGIEAKFSSGTTPFPIDGDNQIQDVVEIEVSTQTDPLPDDEDFELGMYDNLDLSMSSSLRDIIDEDSIIGKGRTKSADSSRISRPTSRSERSFKFSDPKISELSKPSVGRTSPTVILVEKRVSSPTRINEHEVILTEASLTVQPIEMDESQIPDVPPLPRMRRTPSTADGTKIVSALRSSTVSEERAIERTSEPCREVQLDNLITQRLQVKDLDVGRLNVSELQASKILVSDIEGMTLQVTELDSKSGHISVSGIEFSQSVIDEIVKKFSEITTSTQPTVPVRQKLEAQEQQTTEISTLTEKLESKEEQTQTDTPPSPPSPPELVEIKVESKSSVDYDQIRPPPVSPTSGMEEGSVPPQRPPPPDLTPLLYSYLQDIALSPASYQARSFRERPFGEHLESQHQTPPPPTRRTKRKPTAPYSGSSSDEGKLRPSPRRVPPPVRAPEPTITEAGAQFLRVCQNSISRTIRNIFNSFMSYISGREDKKDVQMALVIFLVLIAGLIMFGLSDSRTIHHHHWEFFNPPDNNA
ncbi:uncharacterized protein [Epargyreus clarus]